MNFNKWYKKQIESNQEHPPEKVWEEVQNALDIDIIWAQIDQEIPAAITSPQTSRRITPFISMAATLALFMVSATMLLTLFMRSGLQESGLVSDHEVPAYLSPANTALPISLAGITGTGITKRKPAERNRLPLVLQISPITPSDAEMGRIPVSGLPTTYIAQRPVYEERSIVPADLFRELQQEDIMATRSVYIGVSGQMANTWLLNNKTIGGLQLYETTSTLASYGESFGLVAGMGVGDRVHLEMGLDIISNKRQGYSEYMHGRFVNTELELDYTKLSFHAAYNWPQYSSFNLVAGLYTALLRSAEFSVNGLAADVSSDYRSMDYGLLAGYEFSRAATKSLYVGAGVYSHYGLTNVFSGSQLIPRDMGQTQLLSFQFGVHLRYQLR